MPERLVLIVLIDALDHCLVGDGGFMPELDRPRAPVRSVLGFSSANIPTILTGLPPERHGHFMMYRRAGRDSAFRRVGPLLSAASRITGRHWQLRQLAARQLRWSGITGYFSLYDVPLPWIGRFDLCQRKNLFRRGGFHGLESLTDLILGRGGRVWGWDVPEERSFLEVGQEIDQGERRALLVYTPFLDGLMHAVGPHDLQVREALSRYEETIRDWIRRAASRYGEIRVFIFGDHGMAPITAHHDLWGGLLSLSSQAPRDYLYFLDSTMARFWFHRDQARAEVTRFLEEQGYGRILPQEELERLGAAFPGREYGELLFLFQEGRIILPSFMFSRPIRGMHGYHPDDPHSFTSLVTNAPGLDYPADLMELHRMLRREIEEAAP